MRPCVIDYDRNTSGRKVALSDSYSLVRFITRPQPCMPMPMPICPWRLREAECNVVKQERFSQNILKKHEGSNGYCKDHTQSTRSRSDTIHTGN